MATNAHPRAQIPLSSAQVTVLLEYLMRPEGLAYNQPLIAEIAAEVSPERYQQAVNQAARRFEMLFSCYECVDAEASFTVGPARDIEVTVYDSKADAAARFVTPFDLASGLLVRAGMVRYDGQVTCLLLDFHHIATDGVSLGFFSKELAAALAGQSPTRVYGSLAKHVFRQGKEPGEVAARDRSAVFLKDALAAGIRRTPWPSTITHDDSDAPASLGYAAERFNLDIDLSKSLKARALETKHTAFRLFYLAFLATHALVAQRSEITSAFVASGRARDSSFDVYGMLSKTILCPVRLDRGHSILRTLDSLGSQIDDALQHQELSPQNVLSAVARANGERVLIDALFVFQNIAFLRQSILGGFLRSFSEARKEVQFDMVIHVFDLGTRGHEIHWEYSPTKYSREDVCHFAGLFEALLRRLAGTDLSVTFGDLLGDAAEVSAPEADVPELDFS